MEKETGSGSERKVIVFQLDNEEYAVSIHQVSSIERMQPITRVPNTAGFVKGVINFRGVVTPIIDLRNRLGMKETEFNELTRIVIAYTGEMEVGLIVDAANDVIDINEDKIEDAADIAGKVKPDYIEGVAKSDQRLLILLDLEKVLTEKEIAEANMRKDK